jgi:hypothetical protein
VYNDGMSDERKASARTSIRRIAYAATGAAMVLFGALWIALPFLIFQGAAMTKQSPAELYLTLVPYIGLVPIGYGLLLIYGAVDADRLRRVQAKVTAALLWFFFGRRPGEDAGPNLW